MKTAHRFLPLLVLLAILAGALWLSAGAASPPNSALAAPLSTPMISRSVLGGGGGIAIGATYEMHTTIGQPVVGFDGERILCAGYWCLLANNFHTFMPMIAR